MSCSRSGRACEGPRRLPSRPEQARQDSNLQPPGLERPSCNGGVAAFGEPQELSFDGSTPASLENAGVGTNPGTGRRRSGRQARCSSGPSYFTVMLPAVTVAVGNATALRINPRLPAETHLLRARPPNAPDPELGQQVQQALNLSVDCRIETRPVVVSGEPVVAAVPRVARVPAGRDREVVLRIGV